MGDIGILASTDPVALEKARQSARRWLRGCQPYAPAALYPRNIFIFWRFSVGIRARMLLIKKKLILDFPQPLHATASSAFVIL
jgi:hypothetical protein